MYVYVYVVCVCVCVRVWELLKQAVYVCEWTFT